MAQYFSEKYFQSSTVQVRIPLTVYTLSTRVPATVVEDVHVYPLNYHPFLTIISFRFQFPAFPLLIKYMIAFRIF